ncbi:MAG TPA: lysylphosphatidylglycerol synthase transmembrane domain-containing protein [Nitriliruptoraceae bacterium]|nr:lysylphosphatidylglycerol synthase transmembrane domain-containing protein [Nitriliruptoraceae bacterium]
MTSPEPGTDARADTDAPVPTRLLTSPDGEELTHAESATTAEEMGADEEHAAPKSPVRRLAMLVPLGALVYVILLGVGDIGSAVDVLRTISPALVAAAVLCEVVAVLTFAMVYRASLHSVGNDIGYAASLETSMSAFTVTQSMPGGGGIAVVVATQRMVSKGAGRAHAATAVALANTLRLTTLVIVVTIAFVASGATNYLPPVLLAVFGAILVALATFTWTLLRALRSVEAGQRFVARLERLLRRFNVDLSEWAASLQEVAADHPSLGDLSRVIAWAAVNWTADVGVLWFILAGLGEPASLGMVLVAFGVQHLAASIPISPGGLGLVEAGMSTALVAMGMPASVAIAGVLGYRILAYWLPLMAGIPQYLRGQ